MVIMKENDQDCFCARTRGCGTSAPFRNWVWERRSHSQQSTTKCVWRILPHSGDFMWERTALVQSSSLTQTITQKRRTGPHQPLFDAVHPCQNTTTDELTVYLSYSMFHSPAAASSSGAIAKYMAKDMRIICHQRRERYVSSSSAFCMFALCDYAINVAFAIIINTGHTRVFWDIFEILNTRRRQSRKKCS